ncbi:serine/arginine repetitive matrix protein 1-like [Helianthus annuus]|uniref:serine/arginine repetitive matrix protein 1-like n=1 Tax=Helianthus annuus TaxID=4232 RepID=UPI000B8FA18D|nr:serine/arginine repetitive matrix protein 1-like [Helianthus annuus]
MGKLKEVDTELEKSESVSTVSGKQESDQKSGVQEVKVSESELKNVGKQDVTIIWDEQGVEKVVSIPETPCQQCLQPCKKVTPKSQEGEGSSSQPKKKQKKAAKTLLIDEPEVEEPVVTTEEDPYADIDQVMLNVDDLVSEQAANVEAEKEKVIDDVEGDDVNKSTTSSSSSSDEDIDETERLRRIQEATEKEKQLKKRKRQEKDAAAYVPSPEHVSESQSPLSGKKKAGARKRIVSPKIKKVTTKITKPKIVLKKKTAKEPSKPPTPPPEPTPHQSTIQSPPHQSPPRQPSPPKQPIPPRQPSPLHLSPLHL